MAKSPLDLIGTSGEAHSISDADGKSAIFTERVFDCVGPHAERFSDLR
jgi:hypothetical protein